MRKEKFDDKLARKISEVLAGENIEYCIESLSMVLSYSFMVKHKENKFMAMEEMADYMARVVETVIEECK